MFRTWFVRLLAMELTLSVRSFQVPANAGTTAWPPPLPSVPTSRATRVASAAETAQLVHHGIDRVFELKNFASNVGRDFLGQVAVRDGDGDLSDVPPGW